MQFGVIEKPQGIVISDELSNRCHRFAYEQGSSYYKEARQAAGSPVRQIWYGKIGEYVAAEYLSNLGLPWLEPDVNIYNVKSKSWKEDLPYSELHLGLPDVGVKAVESFTWSVEANQPSWCFSVKDKGITPESNSLVAFTYVRTDWKPIKGYVLALMPVKALFAHNLWRLPEKEEFRKSKRVINYLDMKRIKGLI